MGTLPRPAVLPPITQRILQAIEDRGLSQVKVRELAGIPEWEWKQQSYVGQWRTATLAAIARVLQMPVEILGGSDALASALHYGLTKAKPGTAAYLLAREVQTLRVSVETLAGA